MKKKRKAGILTRPETRPPNPAETEIPVSAEKNAEPEVLTVTVPDAIKSLYRRLLGRAADPAGIEVYTQMVKQQGNLDGVVVGLMATNEYRKKLVLCSPGDPVYLGDHRALIWTTHGLRMYVDTRDIVVAPHLMQLGYWESWITGEFLKYLKKGGTVVEVGSNMGYYTMLASWMVGATGKVFAFEANPDLCDLVFKSGEINGFHGRYEIINKAVTDQSGTAPFHVWGAHLGLGSLHGFDQRWVEMNHDKLKEITVETVALDAFLEERGVSQVDLVKIDAEGSEPLIFKGLEKTLERCENITVIFELSPLSRAMGFDVLGMLEGFVKKGFTLYRIEPFGPLFRIESMKETLSWPGCEILMQKRTPMERQSAIEPGHGQPSEAVSNASREMQHPA